VFSIYDKACNASACHFNCVRVAFFTCSVIGLITRNNFFFSQHSMLQVHDRAQVFTLCHSEDNNRRPTHVGSIDRLSSKKLGLPNAKCASNISLFVLVPDYPVSREKNY